MRVWYQSLFSLLQKKKHLVTKFTKWQFLSRFYLPILICFAVLCVRTIHFRTTHLIWKQWKDIATFHLNKIYIMHIHVVVFCEYNMRGLCVIHVHAGILRYIEPKNGQVVYQYFKISHTVFVTCIHSRMIASYTSLLW